MSIQIPQGISDKITYRFDIANMNGRELVSVSLSSDTLLLSNIVNDTVGFNVTVDSNGVEGSTMIKVTLNLLNGDIENKCIKFIIGKICI